MKLGINSIVASGDADLEAIVNINNYENYAVQINYGAGTSTIAKLQASLDSAPEQGIDGSWVDVEDSQQTLSAGGGTFVWNVNNAFYPMLKVVIDGDAVDCEIIFAGDAIPRRG